METIYMFDEFLGENIPDTIHQKRLKLEPLIFDVLKIRYYTIFDTFWKNNSIIKNTNKSIVIIERRIHENLAFLLRNMFYYAREWAITIICSDQNYRYIKQICTNNMNNVIILQLFNGNPSREDGIKEYNDILKSSDFYESLKYEHLFIVQTDTYLRKPIDETMLEYDYVAAPWAWDETSAGGGMSYRKRSSMIDICKRFTKDISMEDGFINEGIKALGYKMPEFYKGITYISESCHYDDVMGVHQWWTFLNPDDEFSKEILNKYLKLEILKD